MKTKRKIVGYEITKTESGSERASEVYELTEAERATTKEMARLKRIAEKGREADKKSTEILATCSHRVVLDTPGWMYDFRNCVICGKGLGLI